MARTDLYSILSGYAGKIKSPYVKTGEFIAFLEKYAARKAPEEPEWKKWAVNTGGKFYEELAELTDDGRCVFIEDGRDNRVFIPGYCRFRIEDAYKDIDKLAGMPFHDETSLNLEMPPGFARTYYLLNDMHIFFNKSEETPESIDVISLVFPQTLGSGLLLAGMIPARLTEMALLKVRYYLEGFNNKDYLLNKLLGQMPGKEKIVRDMMEQIMVRPLNCLGEMERSADFPYLFWTYFCPMLKNDIKKRTEILPEDQAALQAVCIIEVCCSFYRAQAAKKRDVDAAFSTLEAMMDRSPWHFTLDEITDFTNDKGVLLLDIYSKKELEQYIQRAIVKSKNGALPAWVVLHAAEGERWYIRKERYLFICTRMLMSTQPMVKAAISKRWDKMVRNYQKEPPMISDAEFERMLELQTKIENPVLHAILEDPKLQWAYDELDKIQGAIPQGSHIFNNGNLLPYSALYSLRRKDLLSSITLRLPFWYSVPPLFALIGFFKRLKKKKAGQPEREENEKSENAAEQYFNELTQSARLIEAALVPVDKTLDQYLLELEERWVRLLNKKDRENLLIDVRSLLKDNLRKAMKVYKLKRITEKGLREMSELLIKSNPVLQKIKEKEALLLYMELFMLKLLLNRRRK